MKPQGADLLMNARIKQMDAAKLSPTERAEFIYQLVKEAAIGDSIEFKEIPWDLLCFSVEWIGSYAIMVQDEDLLSLAKLVTQYVYSLHYSFDPKLDVTSTIIGPDREIHKKAWEKRIKNINPEGLCEHCHVTPTNNRVHICEVCMKEFRNQWYPPEENSNGEETRSNEEQILSSPEGRSEGDFGSGGGDRTEKEMEVGQFFLKLDN